MKWTEEQRQAIEIRDMSILVSAAAGSGKTAVLVERIKQLILQENLSLDELLVVTFTNAAASEMREKIVATIPEQMDQIHKSHISTFHSYALEVIRRYFHMTDIDPGFKICDDAQRILLQNEAMEKLFQHRFEKQDPKFLGFIRLYGGSKNEDAVKGMILELYDFIQSLPDPYSWLELKTEMLSVDCDDFKSGPLFKELLLNIKEGLASVTFELKRVSEIVSDHGLDRLTAKAEADLRMTEKIWRDFMEDYDKGFESLSGAAFQRFTATKEEKPVYEEIKDEIKLIRDESKDALKKLAAMYCAKPLAEYISEINDTFQSALTLKDLVSEFNNYYSEAKRKKNLLDFSDIEHYALAILSEEAASSEYRNKFKYIFIDEYQDSNLVQEALIEKIRRDGNVFMVGDVKQSIYKFRLAEPEIFINKYERFRNGEDPHGMKLDLNRNFRSKEPVIQAVNHLFSRIMNKRSSGIEYDDSAALYKGIDYSGDTEHKVEFHLVDDKIIDDSDLDDEIKAMKKAEIEALAAAAIIKEARGAPYYNVKKNEERKLEYKDMVILLRSASGIAGIYCEAFEHEGIPVYIDTGDGYFDTMEVSVFMNLLKVIDNRKQDIPLISILRSAIFGFTIDELAIIRSEYKTGSYFDAFSHYINEGDNESIKEKCKRAVNDLGQWRKQSRLLPLSEYIWKLIRETGYYTYVGALSGGTQRQANLRALSEKAGQYETGSGKGLFGFINYIEAIIKKKIAVAPVKLLGENDDVVRIMTVHKSKGLEFPMVLLGGLGRSFHRESGGTLSLHKELGIALRQIEKGRRYYRNTLLQNIIGARVSWEAMAEEIRILYVALTRAMDKLVLLGYAADVEKAVNKAAAKDVSNIVNGRSYLDFLLPGFRDNQEISFHIHNRQSMGLIRAEQKGIKERLWHEMENGFSEDAEVRSAVRQRLDWEYGYLGALSSKSKYAVSELNKYEKDRRPAVGTQRQIQSEKAAEGIIYHKVMEHIPLHDGEYNSDMVDQYVLDLINGEILTGEEAAKIDPMRILRFLQSDLGVRLRKAEKVYREKAFNMLYEKDGEVIIVQGIIDCFFIEKGKYILIDFKSGYATYSAENIDTIVDSYSGQMKLYRRALEQIRGATVEEAYLYLFSINKAIRI